MSNRNLVNNVKNFVLVTLISVPVHIFILCPLLPNYEEFPTGVKVVIIAGFALVSGGIATENGKKKGNNHISAAVFDAIFTKPANWILGKIKGGKPR